MCPTHTVKTPGRSKSCRTSPAIGFIGALVVTLAASPALAGEPAKSTPVRIAVFDFELQDVSPAASLLDKTTSSPATMLKVSTEARRELAQSGRYELIDVSKVDARPVAEKSLRNCGGCEADIALQLGAEQSLIGVVTRVTQTDYYVLIQIRDARTGKVLNQQEANFAGGEESWASGARMLIKHQVLATSD